MKRIFIVSAGSFIGGVYRYTPLQLMQSKAVGV